MPSLRFDAIGTQWEVLIESPIAGDALAELEASIKRRIEQFDYAYSRFRPDSIVTQIAQRGGQYTLPDDAKQLLAAYQKAYHATAGEVTPLIGSTLSDMGYDADYSFQAGSVHVPAAMPEVISYHHPVLTVKEPVLLDFGAAGKGYLVDIIAQLLRDAGVAEYCVDAGGDMVCHSNTNTPTVVGLQHPTDPTQVIGKVAIYNQALCGSSRFGRMWGEHQHIVSPSSLSTPQHIDAVWVVASTALDADMITTCLHFAKPEVLQKHYQFEYALVHNNQWTYSPNFPGTFFA